MQYNFTIDDTKYFLDGRTLKLFEEFLPEETGEVQLFQKESDELYKVTFIVANVCNGKCAYCYESGGSFGRKEAVMNRNTADNILQNIRTQFKHIRTVVFFGGEAMLNFDLIEYIVHQMEKEIKVDSFEVVTNGTMINNEIIQFLETYRFKVTISLDGPKAIHNKLRRNCPYELVIRTIHQIQNTLIKDRLELNCTYTKYHQENILRQELEQFFESFGVKYHISSVVTDINWLRLSFDKCEQERCRESIDISLERIYTNSKNKDISSYVRAVIEGLVDRKYHEKFCYELCEDSYRFYDYDGKLIPCVRFIDTDVMNEKDIKNINEKNDKTCKECWARGLCSDCTANFIFQTGKAPYEESDCIKKELYAYALQKLVRMLKKDPLRFQSVIDHYYESY